jgi:Ca-activated chloride channel family protein
MAAVALDPAGGDLVVRGRLGNEVWERHVEVSAVECGVGSSAVLARWAREAVADAELRFAGGSREEEEVIERLGLDFGIATRRTSWVAISDEATVDPTQPTRRVEMQMLRSGCRPSASG